MGPFRCTLWNSSTTLFSLGTFCDCFFWYSDSCTCKNVLRTEAGLSRGVDTLNFTLEHLNLGKYLQTLELCTGREVFYLVNKFCLLKNGVTDQDWEQVGLINVRPMMWVKMRKVRSITSFVQSKLGVIPRPIYFFLVSSCQKITLCLRKYFHLFQLLHRPR